MNNSRVKSGRRLAAGFALFASISLPGGPAFAQEANVLQAPEGARPSGPVPQSLAEPSGNASSSGGPQRIVPSGYGATSPSSVQQQVEPSKPSQFFPTGQQATEPSVRVLSAIPGSANSGIEIGSLSGVDAASAGLISQQQGGFGPSMWQGASRADIDQYLARLPVATRSPVMNDLARRLLLTGAQPPEGGGGTSLVATRLNRLVAAGETEAAVELGKAAGSPRSPAVAAGLAQAALAQGDARLACDALKDIPPGNDPAHDAMAAFTVKLSSYCQISAGNPEIASLTVDLAREEGLDDALFYSLAGQAYAGIMLRAPEPNRLSIIDASFYRLAERELPANAVEIAEPALLPQLLADPSVSDDMKVAAAERAAAYGLIPGRELAAYYSKPQFTPEQMAGLLTSDIPEASPLRRAMIYQAIGGAVAADERIQLFKLAFATAESAGLYYPTVEALYPELESLTPSDALRPLAPAATRAFLAIGERSKAQEWFSLLASGGQMIGRDVRELSGLMRVAGGSPQAFNSEQASAEIIADLKSGVKSTKVYAASEAMLLDALGFQLMPAVWEALLNARDALGGTVPPEALLNRLQAAGRKGAVGETVMLALDALGESGPGAVHPRAAAQAAASLKAVNLENEARLLALEALLARSNAGRG
ncbi:hypothetical protein Plav_1719 [Parvibaculum lavamentivorans DS-1]|uniref:Antifreeze glycopeptide polyprotein n=1 Tax=Parvibaculum lavamentivorans (strain DS-1 / DSM 13023 / NCIMB 13966) TaxID=402881 RepID=A7HTV5_PARL1|nr:hypothetical protein [Parvibaculum lavamentivorans]ABS63338.1 hypothetical protein Plav_1719 [Parvibaculum lavamentivorans DS-1]